VYSEKIPIDRLRCGPKRDNVSTINGLGNGVGNVLRILRGSWPSGPETHFGVDPGNGAATIVNLAEGL
jgi:hypothetical protein